MKRIDRCHVVDDKGSVIILFGHFNGLVCKRINGEKTHALVSYYKNSDEAFANENIIRGIFPLSQVYFVSEDNPYEPK